MTPSRLSRLLLYSHAPKYREKISAMKNGTISDSINAGMIAQVRQRGKDQQSLEAAKIGDIANKTYQGRLNYGLVDTRLELQQIRHDGERQRWESSMNVLKCHIAHLEEIVTRQGEELKRLRR